MDKIFGQHDGVFSAGELMNFWDAGYLRNQKCSCGASIQKCEIWAEVIQKFKKNNEITINELIILKKSIVRNSNLWRFMFPVLQTNKFKSDLSVYVRCLKSFYEIIFSVNKSRILIDSSKHPINLFLLNMISGEFDVKVLHLVRDVRAVAYSRKTLKRKLAIVDRVEYMPRDSISTSLYKWIIPNILVHMYADKSKYTFVRYEDFVRYPSICVENILRPIFGACLNIDYINGREVMLSSPGHLCLGNPMKFASGKTLLREDEKWRQGLGRFKKIIITLCSFPLLKLYKYL